MTIVNGLKDFAAWLRNPATGNAKEPGRIDRLCRELGWSIDERDGDSVYLYFIGKSRGDRQIVMIHDGDDLLALVACVSSLSLPPAKVPANIFGYLLNRNCELALGAWQVKDKKDGNCSFAVVYEAIGPGLSAGILKFICTKMVQEVAEFEARARSAGLL